MFQRSHEPGAGIGPRTREGAGTDAGWEWKRAKKAKTANVSVPLVTHMTLVTVLRGTEVVRGDGIVGAGGLSGVETGQGVAGARSGIETGQDALAGC